MTTITDPQAGLRAELNNQLEDAYSARPAPLEPFAILRAQLDYARTKQSPALAFAAIGPDLTTTSTLDLLTEAETTEAHLASLPDAVDPEVWAAQGHDLKDFPLLSGTRLGDATLEDLEADHKAMASRTAHLERLVELHRELAARRLAGKAVN